MNVRTILLGAVAVITIIFGAFIYAGGIFLAFAFGSFPWWFLAFFPVIGQIYLLWLAWELTATFVNSYAITLVVFALILGLFVILAVMSDKENV